MKKKEVTAINYLSENVIKFLTEIAKNTENLTGEKFDLQDMFNACFDQGICYYLQHYKVKEYGQVSCAGKVD